MNRGDNVPKVTANITLEMTKPEITGVDFDNIKLWIKTNVIDKLPANATQTHDIHYTP